MSNRQSTKQTAAAARPAPTEQTAEKPSEHVVAHGETLEGIADKTGVPAPQLKRLNAIKRSDLIWPGMRLRTA